MSLEFVTEFDTAEPDYSFDLYRVMFDPETDRYHVGQDSGCSCPTPFEDFGTVSDWSSPMNAREVISDIRGTTVNGGPDLIDQKCRAVDQVTEHAKAHQLW